MKENFNYQDVPKGYVHCLNAQCQHASECLRAKAGLFADEKVHYFRTINPVYVSNQEECRYFHPDLLIRYASGVTNLFVNLPYKKALKLKKIVHNYFGHSVYYRVYNQTRLISPEEQAFIREVFIKEGIETEPVYNEYIEKRNFFSS